MKKYAFIRVLISGILGIPMWYTFRPQMYEWIGLARGTGRMKQSTSSTGCKEEYVCL